MLKFSIIIVCCFLFCHKEPVIILKTTKQNWTGGTVESGSGCYYNIELVANQSSEKLKISNIWIGEEQYLTDVYLKGNYTIKNKFEKNDSLYIKINKFFNEGYIKSEKMKKPYDYKCEALLCLVIKGKEKFIEIEKFEVLPKLNYPSMKK